VKKELAAKYKFAIGFAWMVITFWSCTNDINGLGKDLLLPGDLVRVGKVIETNIKAFQETDLKQRTDRPVNNLLGSLNDPIFGKTTADFACQFRLPTYPLYKENDIIDSLVFYTAYKYIYGDTLTPQTFKVYELASDLSATAKYYQDIDLKGLAKSNVLAELNYTPRFKLDSLTTTYGSTKKIPKDTVTHEIAFQLDHSLAKYLMKADSLTQSDNDLFVKYFKGLYIEAGDLNQGGTILKILGSGMLLYYRKDGDTTKYRQSYSISSTAARVNRFTHDYSQTAFAAYLDKDVTQDSLIYLQTTGGLRAKILIPKLEYWARLIPNVASSSDTANLIINKAELIFQVDSASIDTFKYVPAEQLVLAAIDKSKANLDSTYLPSDHSLSAAYYGGIYNSVDKTYRFNIAKHLQDVIEKKKKNYGFYLETAYKNSTFRRVVLKGANSKTGIKLEITYSKIK